MKYRQTKRDVFGEVQWQGSWRLRLQSAHKYPSFRKDSKNSHPCSPPSPPSSEEEEALSSQPACQCNAEVSSADAAHPTEGEAPLLTTICLRRGAARSQDYWREWGCRAPKERGTGEEQGQALPPQSRGRERRPELADGASAPAPGTERGCRNVCRLNAYPETHPTRMSPLDRGRSSWQGTVGDGNEAGGNISLPHARPSSWPLRWALLSTLHRKAAGAGAHEREVWYREKRGSVRAGLSLWPGHCVDSLSSSLIPHNPAVGTSDPIFTD